MKGTVYERLRRHEWLERRTDMDGIGRFLDLVIVVIKHLSQEFLPLISPSHTFARRYISKTH